MLTTTLVADRRTETASEAMPATKNDLRLQPKAQARAAEYRRLAAQAMAIHLANPLENVRETQQRAAATWVALAEIEERRLERPASGHGA